MSGGEEGALLGPSIMPCGDRTAYGKVEQIFTSIAAQADRVPCCTLPAHRRRDDGPNARVDAVGLVPGDVVVLEAGDRVPAGGRLLSATSLWVQESALTGEAQPVVKSATAQVADWAPLG